MNTMRGRRPTRELSQRAGRGRADTAVGDGWRPKTFTLAERGENMKIAKSKPAEHGLPFSTESLAKLADFLAAAQSEWNLKAG